MNTATVSDRNRDPKGIPTGGQFAAERRGESGSDLSLVPTPSSIWDERIAELEGEGYVEATATRSRLSTSDSNKRMFWRQAAATAEYGHEKGGYARMSESDGRLAQYKGSDVSLRMPNRSAIVNFAQDGKTFEIPVVVDADGGSVTGWVRATRAEDGSWETSSLGFDKTQSARVAEAVNAVLESQRPRTALEDNNTLLQRRAQRRAARSGVKLQSVDSSAMESMAYDEATGTMYVKFPDYFRKSDQSWVGGGVYGYAVDHETFTKVRDADSMGKAFSQHIRNKDLGVDITRCTKCTRWHGAEQPHTCPGEAGQSNRSKRVNFEADREAVASQLRRRRQR